MADALVIVESPAKAKTIGKFLGNRYKVVASNGHVRDLPKSGKGVDVEHDFAPKYITLRGRGEVLERIRKDAKNAKKIYLATDPDREGEAISWHLAKILNIDENSKCRIVFNEITSTAVKGSIKNARAVDMRLVDAQQARRILDRLVGYEISPLLWKKVRKGLSAGRVQSVAVRMICDREQEVLDFVAEEYWLIDAILANDAVKKPFNTRYYGEAGRKRDVRTAEEAEEIVNRTKNATFRVTDIKNGEKTRHAAPPFTTSTLQQEAARGLGFTTKRTMMIAQQLYEGVELGKTGTAGLITYIRTDSVRVASEAQYAASAYIGEHYGDRYLPAKPNVYKGRKNAQDAHEAIRPTSMENTPAQVKQYLSAEQNKLYKLIFERFLASQMSNALYAVTNVTLDANGATFKSNGVRTIFDGFTAVYTEGKDETQENEVVLPEIRDDMQFTAQNVESEQKFTQPPSRYTEASLVKTLEEKGIGRPSTYAPTISTIVDRGYVIRERKLLKPTDLGIHVNNWMKRNFVDIVDVGFTSDMENKLDVVEDGNTSWVDVVRAFYGPFHAAVEAAEKPEPDLFPDVSSDVICEKCGARMVYKEGRFGKFLACPNFPNCRNTKPIIEKIDVPCPKCGAALIKRKGKKGKIFYGCEKYPDCDFVSWDKPVNMKCPQCGSLMVQKIGKNGSYLTCMSKECGYIHRAPKKAKENE